MNSVFVPKSIKNHSNIQDEEIRAFYSLRPVNASNSDYDFNKQLDRIITEYMETQSFKTDNARRCFKKQLKKMILVDKPKNSKKYDNFRSWRLKQIAIHKSSQRDAVIDTIKNKDLSKWKKYNDLYKKYKEKNNLFDELMKENQELKEKLKKYESGSIIDILPKEEEIIEKIQELPKKEEPKKEKPKKEKTKKEEPKKQEIIKKVKKVKKVKKEKLKLVFKTENISEEKYKSMDNDDERIKAFWEQMDKGIEECERFFIKTCKRDAEHITEISEIFYDFHNEDYGNILEAIEGDIDTDKLGDKPFDILSDNLNQESK